MKPFRTQFVECRNNGFHGKGFPVNQSPLLKKVDETKLKETCTVSCLKFGGICHSGNKACVDMRSLL